MYICFVPVEITSHLFLRSVESTFAPPSKRRLSMEKIVIAAGGTGGHLYPAVRLASGLTDYEILFLGGGLDRSAYFDKSKYAFNAIDAYPWKGFSLGNLWNLTKGNITGFFQARKALKAYSPLAVIGFGSFHTLPVMAAAQFCDVPLFQYEANSVPGKVIRMFSSYASETAVQFPFTKNILKGSTQQISMAGKFAAIDKPALKPVAYDYFNLSPNRKTLLVAGGSQGAEAINTAVLQAFTVTPLDDWQIVHLVGKTAQLEKYQAAYARANIQACVKPFEEKMDLAWAIADFFIGRSGAGTVAEVLQTGTPSLFIPYPFASEDHQKHNADFIADVVKGGKVLPQNSLDPRTLYDAFQYSIEQLDTWKNALHNYTSHITLPSLETAVKAFLHRLKENP